MKHKVFIWTFYAYAGPCIAFHDQECTLNSVICHMSPSELKISPLSLVIIARSGTLPVVVWLDREKYAIEIKGEEGKTDE